MKGKLLKTFASSAVALSMLVGCSSGSGCELSNRIEKIYSEKLS